MQFTDDEIETIKNIINEHGCDYPDTDSNKIQELRYKLGMDNRPTSEEITAYELRMKQWRESDSGKLFKEIMSSHNHLLDDIVKDLTKPVEILFGSIRIKLPNDFNKE